MLPPLPTDDTTAEPDELVPDPQVCREFGISAMSLWRWDRDPALDFPPPIRIRGRKFRSRKLLETFKARFLRRAIEQRRNDASAGHYQKGSR